MPGDMSGYNHNLLETREFFQQRNFAKALLAARTAIKSAPPTATEFGELVWLNFQCECELKLDDPWPEQLFSSQQQPRSLNSQVREIIFLDRRNDTAKTIIMGIIDLIMKQQFDEAASCIAYARTLRARFNSFSEVSVGKTFWSTTDFLRDLGRVEEYRESQLMLIKGFQETIAQLQMKESQLGAVQGYEKIIIQLQEKIVALETELAAVREKQLKMGAIEQVQAEMLHLPGNLSGVNISRSGSSSTFEDICSSSNDGHSEQNGTEHSPRIIFE